MMKVAPDKFSRGIRVIQNYRNWPTYFLDYFGILKDRKIVYTLRNNVKFKARAGSMDSGVISAIWLRKEYTPMGDEITKGDTVVDIGAHIGVFSIYAATCGEGVRVYSYEPLPENFELLKQNIILNQLHTIKAFPMAVAATCERRKLALNGKYKVAQTLMTSSQDYIEVDCTTLRDIFESNSIETCGFLKMDCEGAEYEILFNTPKEYLSRIKKISLEYHPDVEGYRHSYSGEEIIGLLQNMGFEIKSVVMPRRQDDRGLIHARNKRPEAKSEG